MRLASNGNESPQWIDLQNHQTLLLWTTLSEREGGKWFNLNHSSIGNWLKIISNCINNNIYKTLFKNLFENYLTSGAWNAVNFNRPIINFHILHFIINRNKKGEKKVYFWLSNEVIAHRLRTFFHFKFQLFLSH